MAQSWHGRLDEEEEVDKIADAVMTLRRSGLFKVSPVDNTEDGSDGGEDQKLLNIDGVLRPPGGSVFVTDRRAHV